MKSSVFFVLVVTIVASSVSAQCSRSTENYISGLCYSIINRLKTFTEAQNYCYNYNPSSRSHLAIIRTTTQNNFLASLVASKTNIGNQGTFWIGLSRYTFSDRFIWDDGTPLTWYNFDTGFPASQNYVVETVRNGKWQTRRSDEKHVFVCSYDPFNQGETSSTLLTTPELASTTGQPWWFTTEQPWWPTTEETPGTTTGETPGTTTGETPGTTTGETPGATTGETPGTTTGETPGTTTTYDYSTTEEPSTTDDYYSNSSEPPVTSEEPWWWQPTTDDYYYSSSDWLDKSKAVNSYRQMKKKLIK